MKGGADQLPAGHRSQAPAARSRAKGTGPVRVMLAGVLAAAGLAACGTSSASGTPTLNFYLYPDSSGATQKAVNNCNAQAHGRYIISYQQLPTGADGQRQQLARRLAAHDTSLDILGLDVTWESEFATAGWIRPWTGTYKAQAEAGTLKPALNTAIWKGRLWAVPDNTNTQLLWYRSDLVPHPPTTWAQMLADAKQLAKEGKPHYIEIQGAQYEGTTVWFNTMVASEGGTIVNPSATHATLGAPAIKALSIMQQLASSPAADPSLSVQMENQNRLAMEAGTAAFELNYPFVYPAMKADNPKLFKVFKWAPYPGVGPGQPAHVTIGGIDLAVSAYSQHSQDAFQAALCLRDAANQLIGATVGGVPPTIASLYSNPKLFPDYPFHADILHALETASVRPKTPAYEIASIAISHLVSPPNTISAPGTEQSMVTQINDALQFKGLIP